MYVRPPSAKQQQLQPNTHNRIITQMEERMNLNCFICSYTFNTTNRMPKIVCRRQHTYCNECVGLITRARPSRCPQCRFKIYEENIFINRTLFAVCEFFPQLRSEVDHQLEENERLKKENQELMKKIDEMKLYREYSAVEIEKKEQWVTKTRESKRDHLTTPKPKKQLKQRRESFKESIETKQASKNKQKLQTKEKMNPQESSNRKYKLRRLNNGISRVVQNHRPQQSQQMSFNPIIRNYFARY